MPKILVTGGAGYVGSHTAVVLLEGGYEVVIIDNLVNAVQGRDGKPEGLSRVEKICGKTLDYLQVDLLDKISLTKMFKSKGPFDCVIHFAALKGVGESWKMPLKYYSVNCTGTLNLLEVMGQNDCKTIVFSSSATVYGVPQYLPIDEKHSTGGCTSPYGKSKFMTEEILRDLCTSDPEWTAVILRYFDPIGSHPSGLIGEDPAGGVPHHLVPFIAQVAVGRREQLAVFGGDYPTPDGTGVRDYVHVMDVAVGHVAAVQKGGQKSFKGWHAFNLGSGKGHSVLEVVAAFEKASGRPIPFQILPRRAGDIGISYADCSLAEKELGWTAQKSLADMCTDCWRWQSSNPKGFQKE